MVLSCQHGCDWQQDTHRQRTANQRKSVVASLREVPTKLFDTLSWENKIAVKNVLYTWMTPLSWENETFQLDFFISEERGRCCFQRIAIDLASADQNADYVLLSTP